MDEQERFNSGVARRVREAREATEPRLTQAQVGKALGLSKVGYGHYERGAHTFTTWQLVQLSSILGRPAEHFLGLKTDLSPDEVELLGSYRTLTSQFKGVILRIMRTFPQKR